MKTKDQLYQKVSLTPRLHRVVLKVDSKCGLQDRLVQEARSSWESQYDAKRHGETRSSIVDHRIPDIPLSTVERQDVKRQNKVKMLIEMFEKHLHKEQFLKDLSQT